jgi:hypothetical protein
MSEPEWRIRSARPADRDLLASFTCADPAVAWQAEVERFIRTQLISWTFDPNAASGDPRLLLAFVAATEELFGLAAHEREILQGGDGARFHATKLEVVAIAAPWQGRRFQGGERASDVLMSAVMTDVSARVPPRDARVFALVHEDSQRSIALCRRHGLIEEMSRPHPSYRRIVTPHQSRTEGGTHL